MCIFSHQCSTRSSLVWRKRHLKRKGIACDPHVLSQGAVLNHLLFAEEMAEPTQAEAAAQAWLPDSFSRIPRKLGSCIGHQGSFYWAYMIHIHNDVYRKPHVFYVTRYLLSVSGGFGRQYCTNLHEFRLFQVME